MTDNDLLAGSDRVGVAEALGRLRRADDATDLGLTLGLRDEFVRFTGLFDELWESDATFRERWAPRSTRLRQLFSGRYLDRCLGEIARDAGVEIDRQMSEHGGHWDFVGTTRYKPSKGGRSLKLRGVFEPGSAAKSRALVGSMDEQYRKGAGTYSIAELIISPDGELLMLERDVTGGVRHLWAYYVDAFKNRGAAEGEGVTSPDIMDARIFRESNGDWVHRTGHVRVHRSRLRTGATPAWRARAAWLDGDEGTGIVVVPAPGPPAS